MREDSRKENASGSREVLGSRPLGGGKDSLSEMEEVAVTVILILSLNISLIPLMY